MAIPSCVWPRLWNSVRFIQEPLQASAQRYANLLNILVSDSALAPRKEFYTAFPLHQENPCSSTYQVNPGNSQLLGDSQMEHLWTSSYSVFSVHIALNTSVAGSVNIFFLWISILRNIFECHLLKSGRYKNKNSAFLYKCKFVIYATIVLSMKR